jgi:hypothetical protein
MNKIVFQKGTNTLLTDLDQWLYTNISEGKGYYKFNHRNECYFHAYEPKKERYSFIGEGTQTDFKTVVDKLRPVIADDDYDFAKLHTVIYDSAPGWERYVIKDRGDGNGRSYHNHVFVVIDDEQLAILCKLEML